MATMAGFVHELYTALLSVITAAQHAAQLQDVAQLQPCQARVTAS